MKKAFPWQWTDINTDVEKNLYLFSVVPPPIRFQHRSEPWSIRLGICHPESRSRKFVFARIGQLILLGWLESGLSPIFDTRYLLSCCSEARSTGGSNSNAIRATADIRMLIRIGGWGWSWTGYISPRCLKLFKKKLLFSIFILSICYVSF